jgi:hypothetical protein
MNNFAESALPVDKAAVVQKLSPHLSGEPASVEN